MPSALTNVRQLEDALDVLLFDRSSRQAQLTAAGEELLNEGRRLLAEMDGGNRVRRVATGWETQLTVAVDTIIRRSPCSSCARPSTRAAASRGVEHGTRLRVRSEVLAGTWEALLCRDSRSPIGVGTHATPPAASSSRCWATSTSCSRSRRTIRWRITRADQRCRTAATARWPWPIRRSA